MTDEIRSAEKLRVALFSGNYNYVMDGPVRALNKLVEHLENRGHSVLVFAPTIKEPAFQHSGELVSVPSIALPGSRSEYRLGLGLIGGAKSRLKAFRPNLIHIAAPDITGFQALKHAERTGVTPVASFHTRFDTYPRYYNAQWAEKHVTNYMRNFYARCTHVYAPSQSMIDELRADGIGKDLRLWTRGVDFEIFNPDRRDMAWRRANGIDDTDMLVSFVGRVVLEKGIDVFAEAVSIAAQSHPKIKAVIIGEGPERPRFEKKLPDAVFLGYQQGADLARGYASADVFLNPSITETFGNVTLEAMACGSASIGASASGSRSLIEDGETGLLVDPSKGAEGFGKALSQLFEQGPEVWAAMGQAAHRKSEAFRWDTVLDDLIDNYMDAINTRKR
ncbi:MAG: glycosyltransferase family 1 protein [Pseudomonadota bacterium]